MAFPAINPRKANADHDNAGIYNAALIVTGPDNTTITSTAVPIVVSSSCGNISGTVYNDANGNCLIDAGEVIGGINLFLYNGSSLVGWTTSDTNGIYSFNVPTGPTYTIKIIASSGIYGHYTPLCPVNGELSVATIPSTGNDFGVGCPPGFDLVGYVNGWMFRHRKL